MTRNKKTLLIIIAIYVTAGLIAAIIFLNIGHGNANKDVSYEFSDIAGKNVAGNIKIDDIEVTESEEAKRERELREIELAAQRAQTEENANKEEKQFYTFTSLNRFTGLRIRKEPSINGQIIEKMNPGSVGYVLEKGDEWSYVKYGEIIGYSSNKYLSFTEIDKKDLPQDYPEEYK